MPHAMLANFSINYRRLGPSATFARSALGQRVIEIVTSHDAVTALLGAIDAASSRPPHPALVRFLLPEIGIRVVSDDVKVLVGRVVRQAIEFLGGQLVRSGVPITEASVFAHGSIYRLPTTMRGRMNSAERRTWAERQIAAMGRTGSTHADALSA